MQPQTDTGTQTPKFKNHMATEREKKQEQRGGDAPPHRAVHTNTDSGPVCVGGGRGMDVTSTDPRQPHCAATTPGPGTVPVCTHLIRESLA